MSRFKDTIAALATPTGTSAIAVVRISGPDTERIVRELNRDHLPARQVVRGDYRNRDGVLLDDVLFTFFQGPRSYTGEDSLEISSHGNPFIAQKILEDLFDRGCRPAEPGEFTQRAFVNGRMDLSQAEAVMDLIHAQSERALAAANQQLRGELGRRIGEIVQELVGAVARIEAYIDFPEEDLPPEDRRIVLEIIDRAEAEIGRLLATSRYGTLLRDGIKTVIVGAPNAGKSSLLNRLIGRERALVSEEPGTTRDFLEERMILGPLCFRLIDTAGLNPTPGTVERLGIAKTLERCQEADLFILVRDATDHSPLLPEFPRELLTAQNSISVTNKVDLSATQHVVKEHLIDIPSLRVSALTGSGIEELKTAILSLGDKLQRESGSDAIAINARHARALETARDALGSAKVHVESPFPQVELLASDLRSALSALGEIAGRIDNEQVLDALFSTFCIGK
jgi:tRNA modification GTPase